MMKATHSHTRAQSKRLSKFLLVLCFAGTLDYVVGTVLINLRIAASLANPACVIFAQRPVTPFQDAPLTETGWRLRWDWPKASAMARDDAYLRSFPPARTKNEAKFSRFKSEQDDGGWPRQSWTLVRAIDEYGESTKAEGVGYFDALPFAASQGLHLPALRPNGAGIYLPTMPRLGAWIFNIAIITGVLYGLGYLVRLIRTIQVQLRHRNRLCIRCAYPRVIGLPCSECGWSEHSHSVSSLSSASSLAESKS
jgi:hypothetical protein